MEDLSRRLLLRAIAATLGAAAMPAGWTEIALAAADTAAHGDEKFSFFSAADAADVDAVAAQIIPTDDTPGAREAGVIYFIDRALATFFSQLASDYRAQLADFQAAFRKQHPAGDRPRSRRSPSEQQIEFLKTVDRTPFFDSDAAAHAARHVHDAQVRRQSRRHRLEAARLRRSSTSFQPPFGFYDRDYPGFVVEPGRTR